MALIARFPLGFAPLSSAYFSKRELSSVALKRVMEKALWDKKTRASPLSHVRLIVMWPLTFRRWTLDNCVSVSVEEKRRIRAHRDQGWEYGSFLERLLKAAVKSLQSFLHLHNRFLKEKKILYQDNWIAFEFRWNNTSLVSVVHFDLELSCNQGTSQKKCAVQFLILQLSH